MVQLTCLQAINLLDAAKQAGRFVPEKLFQELIEESQHVQQNDERGDEPSDDN